jgi:hypothetical protein
MEKITKREASPFLLDATLLWRSSYNEMHRAYTVRIEMKNAQGILVGKPERKRPLGSRRSTQEDNIKTDLTEVGFVVVDLIEMDGTKAAKFWTS